MPTKIVLIGAGSFVFGPSVLAQTFLDNKLDDVELALVDLDAEIVDLMAGVGRRMAREMGLTARVDGYTDRATVLGGADFVICSASRDMHRRFAMDCATVQQYAPGHVISEFGGVAGISYSLRQIALISEIANDMQVRCPNAWLLNIANPLPRVAQAAHELGIKTAGFCSVSLESYAMAWRMLHGATLHYPFQAARDAWQITSAGLNHFCWVTSIYDRATGEELVPQVRQRLAAGASSSQPRADQMTRETGYLLVPNDSHTKDFLPPQGAPSNASPGHGSPDERQRRLALLQDIGQGRQAWDELLVQPAWERPLDFVAAITKGEPVSFHSLNLINESQIPNLPKNVFVETPCVVDAAGPEPQQMALPDAVLPHCELTAHVTDTIVQAALRRDRTLVHQAVELDPTIEDKTAGHRAIDACLHAHADILPEYH